MSTTKIQEKIKGEKALKIAKAIKRKVIFVPRGVTGDMLAGKKQVRDPRSPKKKGLDHEKILQMLKDGKSQSELARKFKVTAQTISYIKNKAEKSSVNEL